MKKIFKSLLFFLFNCFPLAINAQYIQVDDSYTAQQLVQNVLVNNSPCATVTNIIVSGDTFSGIQNSYGFFSNTTSVFPFTNGIVLSTARAKKSEGPNTSLIDEGSTSWSGDSDLELALGITGSINATSLEFDFTPLSNKMSFDYVFASEEYHDNASCRYSDGFAFLLKEANTQDRYENLALVPNTTTPVKVTSVHPLIPGTNGCPAINEQYFDAFNGTEYPTNFNGQTVVMTARANVIPGRTYHIKLVIADEGNYRYDSAIFLGGGSFNVSANLGENKLIATNNPICEGETYNLDATSPGLNTYLWFKNGVSTGIMTPIYTVTDSGIYKVEITLNGTTCIATGQATIEYSAKPVLTNTILVQCDDDNDGISTFDLTKVSTLITNGNSQLSPVVYFENITDVNPIPNPANYRNLSTNTVYGKVSNQFGCTAFATVNLQIANNPITAQNPIMKCDSDTNQDGFVAFNLNLDATPQILSGLPSGLNVEYYLNANDAVLQRNPLSNSYTNTTIYEQIIFARIVNGPDCFGITPIKLKVIVFAPSNFDDETVYICDGNPKRIAVANGYSSYLWSNGATTSFTSIATAGNYNVTASNAQGCVATKKFIAIASGIATITSIEINDFSGNENSVLINYSGDGDYEFSLDGVHYQNNPLFLNVTEGDYLVYIKDKNDCGIPTPIRIYVLDYPRFFTPNGDSYNDFWTIRNGAKYPNMLLYIFDRYGKLITQVNPKENGWDGSFNGHPIPADDYWFTIILDNNRIIKGHFALLR
jgi:gliding motility-associated-like protein